MTNSTSDEKLHSFIDELCDQRREPCPGSSVKPFYPVIRAYMTGRSSLNDTVRHISDPINTAYSTGDGRECTKREEGTSETMTVLVPLRKGAPTTEGMLLELWYGVIHEAKDTSWKDSDAQGRLVDLVRALNEQPNPAKPDFIQVLRRHLVWSSGELWTDLVLLNTAVKETWNERPGSGSGSDLEMEDIQAWTNLNAFLARMVRENVRDFWVYANWALRDGLEEELMHRGVPYQSAPSYSELDIAVPAAAVWVIVLGKELYDREGGLKTTGPDCENPGLPGRLWEARGGKVEFSKARWAFWKERFEALKTQEGLHQSTKDMAAEAVAKMKECENVS